VRIHKKVRSHDSGLWLVCCWDTCEKNGFELYKVIDREHQAEPVTFVFCSERHKQYFLHSHIALGKLPEGMRNIVG
jgi:hypothetical protein